MPKVKTFFTSDLHIGHANAIKFDKRPFKSVEAMDEEIIRRWNSKVRDGDLVYVLGDMIWNARAKEAEQIIKNLNGRIVLIRGNHDTFVKNQNAIEALEDLKDYADVAVTLEDGTVRRCILSHYFMPFYAGHRRTAIHLHGHSHDSAEARAEFDIAERLNVAGFRNEIYNVGCMHWNYEPVTLDEILAKKQGHFKG